MVEGQPWFFHVPPGWILIGSIASIQEDEVILVNAAHVELVGENRAMSELHFAETVEQQRAICTQAWPLPDGYSIRRDCITHNGPMRLDAGLAWPAPKLEGERPVTEVPKR